VLQIGLKEELLICVFDWQVTLEISCAIIQSIGSEHVQVKVVDDAVGAHGIVSNSQLGLVSHLKRLNHQQE